MFAEMLALGALFWITLIAGVIGLAILIEFDRVGWAGIVTVGLFVAFFFLVDGITFDSLKSSLDTFTLNFLIYVAIGIGWSFAKWYLYLKDRRNDYRDHKEEFYKMKSIELNSDLSEGMKKEFKEYLDSKSFLNSYDAKRKTVIPLAKNHKDRITGWVFWWPISIILSVFRDLATAIYNHLKGVFQKISNHMFKDVEELV